MIAPDSSVVNVRVIVVPPVTLTSLVTASPW